MTFVPSKFALFLPALFLGARLSLPAFAADKPQTFTGNVTDAMCGANHMMAGEAAACVRACINKGSKYALVVGGKVYTLDTSDQTALGELAQLADHQAKVTGQANGETIAVGSVAPAK